MVTDEYENGANLYIELIKKTLTGSLYDESAWLVLGTGKVDGKTVVGVQQKPFSESARNEGRDWPFIGYTMVGHSRLDNIQACVEDVIRNEIPGDFIETGVWRGGSTIFMRALLQVHEITDRKVWVADSFEGLPPPESKEDGGDLSKNPYLKVSLEKVKSNFTKFGLLDDQVQFLEGWFSDTLPVAPIEKLAILRLDGDLYSSTMDGLVNLYPKVSKGGYVIVDDYYSWPSCRKAVTDFLQKNSIEPEIKTIDWTGAYWKCE